ncbi:MAG: histidine phosphatase family protein [Ktedonobacterales bacterium]
MSLEETVADSDLEPSATEEARVDPFLSLKRGATEIYLIRHGDALPDAAEVVGEGYDEQGLSDLGRRQAQALAEYLSRVELGAIYSSPLGRARETAEAVAAASGYPVQVDDELREVALGSIGAAPSPETSREEVAKLLRDRLREIALVAVTSGKWSSIPGSEPSEELRQRVTRAIERIAGRHSEQRVAVVSHGGAINAYLAQVLGIERDYFFPTANTSISVVRVKGRRHMLFALNDISHLRERALFTSDAI